MEIQEDPVLFRKYNLSLQFLVYQTTALFSTLLLRLPLSVCHRREHLTLKNHKFSDCISSWLIILTTHWVTTWTTWTTCPAQYSQVQPITAWAAQFSPVKPTEAKYSPVQSIKFQYSPVQPSRVHYSPVHWAILDYTGLYCTMCTLCSIFFRATEQAQTYLKI